MNSTVKEVEAKSPQGNRRMDDKIKLRELELQTQYELKYLSDSLTDLKKYVKENKKNEDEKSIKLDKKINWIWWLVLAQMAGADVPKLISLFTKAMTI